MNKKCYILFIVITVLVMGGCGIIYAFLIRHDQTTEVVQLSNGSFSPIKLDFFEWRSFGSPHALQIGGGNIVTVLTLAGRTDLPRWVSFKNERCFLVIDNGDDFWLVTLDRTDSSRPKIKGYMTHDKNSWISSSLAGLPVNKAVQNMWLDKHDEEVLFDFNPSSIWVRKSLTARLWWMIENGDDIKEVPGEFVSSMLRSHFSNLKLR